MMKKEYQDTVCGTVGRRDFCKLIGLGTLGLGFGVSIYDSIFQYAEGADKTDEEKKHMLLTVGTVVFMGFRAKEITPNSEFYITTYSSTVPDVNYEAHSLRIEGLVEKPYALTMKELEAMKDRTEFVTLQCIGNPVGGDAIGNALWDGVTLKKLLDRAQPKRALSKRRSLRTMAIATVFPTIWPGLMMCSSRIR